MRCFTSPGIALKPYEFRLQCPTMTRDGFPHSEISGSKRACRSPKLIAAYHVLHRLLMPRHPLCALSSLTKKLWSTPLARVVLDTHLYAVVKDQSRLRGKTRTSKFEIRSRSSFKIRMPNSRSPYCLRCSVAERRPSSQGPSPALVAKTGGRAWNRTGDLVLIRDAL